MLVIKFFVGAAFGFFLPGFLISKLLKSKLPLVSSFLISLLILFHVIFLMGIAGIVLEYRTILILLAAVSLLPACFLRKNKDFTICAGFGWSGRWWRYGIFLIFPLASAVIILLRCTLQPFISPDSLFRWNFLAELIFKYGNFDFYPPFTASDYLIYFYSDGIPPLVSFCYFWLYASLGKVAPAASGVFVVVQFSLMLLLCYKTAKLFFNSRQAGIYAVLMALTSKMLFFSFMLGQETGLTALSLTAVVYFIVAARHEDDWRAMVLAGMAAALGALSREYGVAFIFCGILVCRWRKHSIKSLMIFTLTAVMFSLPWYLRNWQITGNPFYSNLSWGLFPVNEVHTGIVKVWTRYFGLMHNLIPALKVMAKELLRHMPLHTVFFFIFWSLFVISRKFRQTSGYIPVIGGIIVVLWLYSIGQTVGGMSYSMRVLSPVIVLFSIWGGGILYKLTSYLRLRLKKQRAAALRRCMLCGLCGWCLLTVIQTLTFPFPFNPWVQPVKELLRQGFSPLPTIQARIYKYLEPVPTGSRVLSDSAYYHASLSSRLCRNISLVAVWSPEVNFLFDKEKGFMELCERLRQSGIKYVLYSKNSYNNIYLEKFPFFARYQSSSRKLVEGDDSILFKLPAEQEY